MFDTTSFLTPRAMLSSEHQFNLNIVSHFDVSFLFRKRRKRKTKTNRNDGYLVYHVDPNKSRMCKGQPSFLEEKG